MSRMRIHSLFALLLAAVLLATAVGVGVSQRTRESTARDRALTHEAASQAASLQAYFGRARSLILLAAQNPAYRDFYAGRGARSTRIRGGRTLGEVGRGLAYLERLYPGSIGEACFIDRGGAENARVVRGVRARAAKLSPDESGNPFFRPTFALRPGQVYQARPYVSPDTHEWVVSNSTPLPGRGRVRAIVHFEVTVDSFRRTIAASAGGDDVRIVDARSGRAVITSGRPQRVGAPLGARAEFRRLARPGQTGDVLTLAGRRTAYRRVTADPGNENAWYVVASSRKPLPSVLSSVGPGPLGMLAAAAALLAFALVSLRASQRELRAAATTDPLTDLPNRRRLTADLERAAADSRPGAPMALLLFDLDGFKLYNDDFGHPAGDALLARLGRALEAAVAPHGTAYRMGGDEFCVLVALGGIALDELTSACARSLSEHGEGFAISSSYGIVMLPAEAATPAEALRLADQRMYAHKRGGRTSAGRQSKDVLLRAIEARHPGLGAHLGGVADLAGIVAERLGLPPEEIERVRQAAELHDIGKVAIPDAILLRPGPLSDEEWDFIRRHTLIGERIISAAPALGHVARLVRASHEHFDGRGYPDGLAGTEIPIGARIVFGCDAFDAMTSERPYRRAMSTELAVAELRRCAGADFDPAVIDALCDVIAERVAADQRGGAARAPASPAHASVSRSR